MAKRETRFSRYANAFYDILYKGNANKNAFVIELLKMGLSAQGKNLIDTLFSTDEGKKPMESNQADRLRKYLRGENDISIIALNIINYYAEGLYMKHLEDYESDNFKVLADKLGLCIPNEDTQEIGMALAKYHRSILTEASSKKRTTANKAAVPSDSDKSPVNSYTITTEEKSAVRNICEIIERSLKEAKRLTDAIDQKQFELLKLTDSDEDNRWRMHVESDLNSLRAKLNEQYSLLETAGPDAVKLLEPKKHLHPSMEKLYDIAVRINENVYKSTCPEFSYAAFSVMIADFRKAHEQLGRYFDGL